MRLTRKHLKFTSPADEARYMRRVLALCAAGLAITTAATITLAKCDPATTRQPSSQCTYQIKQTTADWFIMDGLTWPDDQGRYHSYRTSRVVGFDLVDRPGFVCMVTTDRLVQI